MKQKKVAKTIVCRTESSHRKRERLQHFIDEWQAVAGYIADIAPSFDEDKWRKLSTPACRRKDDVFEDGYDSYAGNLSAAAQKVMEAYSSWKENGKPSDENPKGQFGDGNYMRVKARYLDIVKNDRGFGLKVKVEPYSDPVWLHLDTHQYHNKHFESVLDGDASIGASEIRIEGDEVYAHIVVTRDVDVLEYDEVETVVGVDIGENVLYTTACVDVDENVSNVVVENGGEFRHHREQISSKYERLQEQDKKRELRQLQNERGQYTEHVTDVASRRVVEVAEQAEKPLIGLETLTNYRKTCEDPIHDWPFAKLQEKICYKATEVGIPVADVNPAYTSTTCRKCGANSKSYRDGPDFECGECGYQVHADVNGAINIAKRVWDQKL